MFWSTKTILWEGVALSDFVWIQPKGMLYPVCCVWLVLCQPRPRPCSDTHRPAAHKATGNTFFEGLGKIWTTVFLWYGGWRVLLSYADSRIFLVVLDAHKTYTILNFLVQSGGVVLLFLFITFDCQVAQAVTLYRLTTFFCIYPAFSGVFETTWCFSVWPWPNPC